MYICACTHTQVCVEHLQRDHRIVQHLLDDVGLLAASLRVDEHHRSPVAAGLTTLPHTVTHTAGAQGQTHALRRSVSQTAFLLEAGEGYAAAASPGGAGESGVGGFVGSECWARLEFLRFFLETSGAGAEPGRVCLCGCVGV